MALFQKPFGSDLSTGMPDIGIGGIQNITERHVACVLLLDTSGSMEENNAIGQLCNGISVFKEQAMSNPASNEQNLACIDVAMVAFGPDVRVIQDFVPLRDMNPRQVLIANGGTPMGSALNLALDMVTEQKARYSQLGTPYFRPWIYCISDGEPNDEWQPAAQRLQQMEREKKVAGYFVGVQNYNAQIMAQIFAHDRLLELENLNFAALFEFLSNSLIAASMSDPSSTSRITVDAPADLHKITLDL